MMHNRKLKDNMNIFQKIWKELTRDHIKEVFERGYNLGRQHEKDKWEFDIRFRFFATKAMVDQKYNEKSEECSTLPVNINFNQSSSSNIGILTVTKDGKNLLKEDFMLVPGYVKDEKGKMTLIEMSVVKRK